MRFFRSARGWKEPAADAMAEGLSRSRLYGRLLDARGQLPKYGAEARIVTLCQKWAILNIG